MNVICKCGAEITGIEYYNGCNELGEDYYEGNATCDSCNEYYEWSEWGENEGLEQVKEDFNNAYKYVSLTAIKTIRRRLK